MLLCDFDGFAGFSIRDLCHTLAGFVKSDMVLNFRPIRSFQRSVTLVDVFKSFIGFESDFTRIGDIVIDLACLATSCQA